jgi:hypothetical protein
MDRYSEARPDRRQVIKRLGSARSHGGNVFPEALKRISGFEIGKDSELAGILLFKQTRRLPKRRRNRLVAFITCRSSVAHRSRPPSGFLKPLLALFSGNVLPGER